VLNQFTLPLSAPAIAKVIGMMVDPQPFAGNKSEQVVLQLESGEAMDTSSATSWNVEVFGRVVSDLVCSPPLKPHLL
jgi:hypothetical protein